MKNIAIICLGIFALCFVGCGHDGSGNMPDAPTSLDGLTYDAAGTLIVFGDGTYTLTGEGLANNNSGDPESGTYTYTTSRSEGTVTLDNGSGAESDFSIIFYHRLFYGDTDHTYLTTGKRYEGSYNAEFGDKTASGEFEATYIEPVSVPVIKAPEVTAPVSAN